MYKNIKNIVQKLHRDKTKWNKVQQYKINKQSTKVSKINRSKNTLRAILYKRRKFKTVSELY